MITNLKNKNKKYTVGIVETVIMLLIVCLASFYAGLSLNNSKNKDGEKKIYILKGLKKIIIIF